MTVTSDSTTSTRRSLHVPVVIRRALTDEARREAQSLRHAVYLARGYTGPRDDPFDADVYDEDAVTLLAYLDGGPERGRAVGTLRLIGMYAGLFLHERVGFTVPSWVPRERTLEVSRWVALPSGGRLLSVFLAMAAEEICRSRGVTHTICNVTTSSRSSVIRGGWECIDTGPPLPIFAAVGSQDLFHPLVIPVPAQPRPLPAHIRLEDIP
jgi:N-acyl-L-homoserine lactone synthetase